MTSPISAALSGTFKIGGERSVSRLGFGTMQLTGPGIWEPPVNPAEALRTLKRLPELGVNFIDTADSYGPNIAEELVRAALHPYGDTVIATKAGLARTGPNQWVPILRRSSVVLPIPGTSKLPHLEENVAAAAVELSDADFAALDSGGRTGR